MVGMITVKLNTHLLHAFRNKPDIEFPRRPLLGSRVNKGVCLLLARLLAKEPSEG